MSENSFRRGYARMDADHSMIQKPELVKHHELTEKIIGVFFHTYNELGYGFLESVYRAAMVIALRLVVQLRSQARVSKIRIRK
jgi:hypothetical protein